MLKDINMFTDILTNMLASVFISPQNLFYFLFFCLLISCISLSASVGVESRFHHLYKVNFDNMASYLQKKQERLQQQNQHGGKKREGWKSNGAAKKCKKEDKSGQKCSSES